MTRPTLPSLVRLTATAALAVVLASCQDGQQAPVESTPNFDISEARTGGNPDFFFYPPLADTPDPTDPVFDAGLANGALRPTVRICVADTSDSTPAGCTEDVTLEQTGSSGGLVMTFNVDNGVYQANWQTKDLNESLEYRIEIWGLPLTGPSQRPDSADGVDARWLFGWRDIANSPSTASCTSETEVCLINFGQTIPVKVRIEQFAFCPVSRNCAAQFVAAGTDANLEALLNDPSAPTSQLFVPGQQGTDFALAFEPCSAQETADVAAAVDIPLFGPCLKTITNFSAELAEPAIISICEEVNVAAFDLADPATQVDQLALHHFTETNTGNVPPGRRFRVEALPEANQCTDPTSGGMANADGNRLRQFARVVGEKMRSLLVPQPLQANAVVIDRGGGGSTGFLESFFQLGLPSKFEYENAGDDFQQGIAGEPFVLRAEVTDLLGGPVKNARVSWAAISSPGGDATAPAGAVLTDGSGIAQQTVQLSATRGNNLFHATGRGIADDRDNGCSVSTLPVGTASCDGPRALLPYGPFDPFLPFHYDTPAHTGFDGPAPMGATEDAIEIAEGTRLPFTVFGCTPGFGTPIAIDGTMAAGEWDCAKSLQFPVNLSGGSTVTATLFWMNDDTSMHFAVAVPGTDRQNGLRIEWDRLGIPMGAQEGDIYSGARDVGNDVWEFEPGSGSADKFINEKCSTSSQSSCGLDDAGFGGSMDTGGAFDNGVGVTVYELSHPLNSGDVCTVAGKNACGSYTGSIDLATSAGQKRGVFITLRLGSGAQGNTQWPGFQQYMVIEIQ